MAVTTIVEDYIFAALKSAVGEDLEDGTIVATIPELPGIIAYGKDCHECSRQLYGLIEETVRLWLSEGHPLPVLGGIDLTAEKERILASYHAPEIEQSSGADYHSDETDLEAAFEAHSKPG